MSFGQRMTRADVLMERAPSRVSPEAETGWPPLLRGPRCCGGVVDPHGSKRYPRESEGAPSLWPRSCGARVLEDAAPLPGGTTAARPLFLGKSKDTSPNSS